METARSAAGAPAHAHAIVLALACACGPPDVDAVAVWLDGEVRANGGRNLRVYDRGDDQVVPLEPREAGANAGTDLRVRVAPHGRGIAIAKEDETVWIGLRDGRRGRFDASLAPIELGFVPDRAFELSPTGDLLWRAFAVTTPESESPQGVALLPLAADAPARWVPMPQPERPCTSGPQSCPRFALLPAADAAIVHFVEHDPDTDALGGRVRALAYPSELAGAGPRVADPTALADGTVGVGAPAPIVDVTQSGCHRGVCVAPEGDALLASGPVDCTVSRWSWRDAGGDAGETAQQTLHLPLGCTPSTEPSPVAAFDEDVLVLEDQRHVHVADLALGIWSTAPKPGDGTVVRAVVARGRALVLVGDDSGVVRVDAEGARAWTTEHIPCPLVESTVVSPAGAWVLRSCPLIETTAPVRPPAEPTTVHQIVRVSPLGAESYVGPVAMLPLAIDDAGHALLYSHDVGSVEPRGLFVLDAAGELSRIDELEPTPQPFASAGGIAAYFSAAAAP